MVIIICRTIGVLTFAISIFAGIFDDENVGQSFINAFTAALFVLLSFLPNILDKEFKLQLPAWLQSVIVLFIFSAEILGEIHNFYERFFWWDVMLHTCSGLIIGYLGFLIIYAINNSPLVQNHMSLLGISAFAFCFALACGVVWEIFEWSCDVLLGMNMQKGVFVNSAAELAPFINQSGRFMDPGLIDTMTDLIVDTLGGLIAAIIGHITIKRMRAEGPAMEDTPNDEIPQNDLPDADDNPIAGTGT